MSKLALIGKSSRIALFLLGGVLSSHWQKCFLKLDCKAHCDVFSYIFYCILGGIPHCERKELLQATLNVIQDDFPNEAIVDIIEFDAFNRLDPCPVIIKPKCDAPFLIENPYCSEMPIPQCVLEFWKSSVIMFYSVLLLLVRNICICIEKSWFLNFIIFSFILATVRNICICIEK